MKLYFSSGSPYARIVRMALIETGLDARVAQEETTLRDPASTLLPVNPVGRVPTLVLDDGTVLGETALILVHLATLPEGRRLLPLDGSDRWRTMSALGRAIGMLDGIAVWNRELRRPEHERSPGVIAHETVRANRVADALERAVAAGGYAAGPGGAVDAAWLALAATLGYCERRHRVWAWREGRPALSAWLDAASARRSFQATVPPVSGI
jgi:glutathione S-transferase